MTSSHPIKTEITWHGGSMYICSLHCFSICVNCFPQTLKNELVYQVVSFMVYLAMHPFFLVGPPGFPGETSTLQEMVSDHRGKTWGFSVHMRQTHARWIMCLKFYCTGSNCFNEIICIRTGSSWLMCIWKVLDIHWYLSLYKDQNY